MNYNDLKLATPYIREFFNALKSEALKRLNLNIIHTQVARTAQYQLALYAQGREPLDKVNRLRKIAGYAPITELENKMKVTWTLASDHIIDLNDADPDNNLSRAVDIGIIYNGKYQGSDKADVNKNTKPDYIELGHLALEIWPDIDWGGAWKKKDYPHYGQPKLLSIEKAQAVEPVSIIKEVV